MKNKLSRAFEKLREQEMKRHKKALAELSYWESVCKRFENHQKKKDKEFSEWFLHKKGHDNEFKIGAYSMEYGYEIYDEEVKSDRTVFCFRKVKENKGK